MIHSLVACGKYVCVEILTKIMNIHVCVEELYRQKEREREREPTHLQIGSIVPCHVR